MFAFFHIYDVYLKLTSACNLPYGREDIEYLGYYRNMRVFTFGWQLKTNTCALSLSLSHTHTHTHIHTHTHTHTDSAIDLIYFIIYTR